MNEGLNLLSHLQKHADTFPDKVAIRVVQGDTQRAEITYAQLLQNSARFAASIGTILGDQQYVPILANRSCSTITAMLGAVRARLPFCCPSLKLGPHQLQSIVGDMRATTLVVDAAGIMVLGRMLASNIDLGIQHIVLNQPEELSPIHAKACERLESAGIKLIVPDQVGDRQIANSDSVNSVATVLFTSGSTGKPKGVLIAESDLIRRSHAEVDAYQITHQDKLLGLLPFSFDVGLNQLFSSLVSGAELLLSESWLPADILQTTENFSVTGISAVPAIWKSFIDQDHQFATDDAHQSLRYITISGGDLTETQLQQIPRIAPRVGVIKTYGQTETFRSTCLLPDQFSTRPKSVGRTFVDVELRIEHEGVACAPGEAGEIVHRGLGVMMGYIDGDQSDGKRQPVGEGEDRQWEIRTGDQGYLDEEGFLYLLGRMDQMVKISGNRVYPAEVTHELFENEHVLEAETVGHALPNGDHELHCFVVSKPESRLAEDDLVQFLRRRLPGYMLPKQIYLIDELPRTATGKIATDELRLQIAKHTQ